MIAKSHRPKSGETIAEPAKHYQVKKTVMQVHKHKRARQEDVERDIKAARYCELLDGKPKTKQVIRLRITTSISNLTN